MAGAFSLPCIIKIFYKKKRVARAIRWHSLLHIWLQRSLHPPQHRRCSSAATPPLPYPSAAAAAGSARLPRVAMGPDLRWRCGARGGCGQQRLPEAMAARAEPLLRRRGQPRGRCLTEAVRGRGRCGRSCSPQRWPCAAPSCSAPV